jgi:hypothetical protein
MVIGNTNKKGVDKPRECSERKDEVKRESHAIPMQERYLVDNAQAHDLYHMLTVTLSQVRRVIDAATQPASSDEPAPEVCLYIVLVKFIVIFAQIGSTLATIRSFAPWLLPLLLSLYRQAMGPTNGGGIASLEELMNSRRRLRLDMSPFRSLVHNMGKQTLANGGCYNFPELLIRAIQRLGAAATMDELKLVTADPEVAAILRICFPSILPVFNATPEWLQCWFPGLEYIDILTISLLLTGDCRHDFGVSETRTHDVIRHETQNGTDCTCTSGQTTLLHSGGRYVNY